MPCGRFGGGGACAPFPPPPPLGPALCLVVASGGDMCPFCPPPLGSGTVLISTFVSWEVVVLIIPIFGYYCHLTLLYRC